MVARLLHGALLGALVAAAASLVEASRVLDAFPHHADYGTWSRLLPWYLSGGALVGLVAGAAAPLVASERLRRDRPRLAVAVAVLPAILAAGLIATARAERLPPTAGMFGAQGLEEFGLALGAGLALLIALRLFAASSWGWTVASFVHPVSCAAGLALLGLLALAGAALAPRPALVADPARAPEAPEGAPNVLFVVLDTVAADHLGCYGYHRPTSPELDALAREGVLFDAAYSTAPWTLPSHTAMFTGLHGPTHGTGWVHPRMHDGAATAEGRMAYDLHTMTEELAQRGYQTCGISEKSWITYDTGLTQGFEYYFDFSIEGLADRFLAARLVARYAPLFGVEEERQRDKGGRRIVDSAKRWLDGERDEDRPFYLFLNLNEAHDPYYPPPEYWDKFLPAHIEVESTYPPRRGGELDQTTDTRRRILTGSETLEEEQVEAMIALYDAEIRYQDDLLGELFEHLRQRNLLESTLVIVTSDHGEEFYELGHRVGHQMALTDRLLHVPLVFRYPELMPAGTRVRSMASTVDVYPTVLDVIDRETGREDVEESPQVRSIEGVSLLDAARPDGRAVRDFVIASYQNPTSFFMGFPEWEPEGVEDWSPMDFPLAHRMRSILAIRGPHEKLVLYGDGNRAFVDFLEDPDESGGEVGEEAAPLPPEKAARARLYERRLHQQLNFHATLRELFTGHYVWFRQHGNLRNAPVGGQATEQLGYVGEIAGVPDDAEGVRLPPLLGFH